MDAHSKQLYLTSLHDIFPIDHFVPDENISIESDVNTGQRFRPEYLKVYQSHLCSDSLTPTSGATRSESEINDAQVIRAGRFLRETWIPSFIKSLDTLETRPFDSRSMTVEMHRNGINIRYLGNMYYQQ